MSPLEGQRLKTADGSVEIDCSSPEGEIWLERINLSREVLSGRRIHDIPACAIALDTGTRPPEVVAGITAVLETATSPSILVYQKSWGCELRFRSSGYTQRISEELTQRPENRHVAAGLSESPSNWEINQVIQILRTDILLVLISALQQEGLEETAMSILTFAQEALNKYLIAYSGPRSYLSQHYAVFDDAKGALDAAILSSDLEAGSEALISLYRFIYAPENRELLRSRTLSAFAGFEILYLLKPAQELLNKAPTPSQTPLTPLDRAILAGHLQGFSSPQIAEALRETTGIGITARAIARYRKALISNARRQWDEVYEEYEAKCAASRSTDPYDESWFKNTLSAANGLVYIAQCEPQNAPLLLPQALATLMIMYQEPAIASSTARPFWERESIPYLEARCRKFITIAKRMARCLHEQRQRRARR